MLTRLRIRLRKLALSLLYHRNLIRTAADAEIRAVTEEIRRLTPDNPALAGFKGYSQADEDGIIEEIFRRIGGGRTFMEIGIGDGTENNTHYLLLKGWSGTWVDGNPDSIASIRAALPGNPQRLEIVEQFVDADNIAGLARDVDFLSLDIDGNDLHVLRRYLAAASPKVVCVEYNARFPPPLVIAVAYNSSHRYAEDDYQGASLQAFVDLMAGYRLVACTVSGVNAFFVRNDLAGKFTEYPAAQLFQPYRYHLFYPRGGQEPTLKFLADALRPSP